ncbi:Factor arrest protein 11 [Rhodotorula kratochvilovae]
MSPPRASESDGEGAADPSQQLKPLASASSSSPPDAALTASLRSRSLAHAQQQHQTQPLARPGVSIPPQPRRPALTLEAASLHRPPHPPQGQPQQGAAPQPHSYAAAGGPPAPGQQQGDPQTTSPQPPPRPKQLVYTFPSPPPDTADLLTELDEFYSYVEVPQVLDHADSWREWWDGEQEFTKSPSSVQHAAITSLLTTLNSSASSASQRQSSARHLLHLAHGAFGPGVSTSQEHHLHLILSSCRVLRAAGALQGVWRALRRTGREWDDASALSAAHAARAAAHAHAHDEDGEEGPYRRYAAPASAHDEAEEQREQERQDRLDEINAELALLLAVLYFMVECFRGEDEWAEELMALEPPMPVYLYNQVAGLREKNAKGYPVKKLLLLLWKSMLCTLGGLKDANRTKVLVREIEGLPKDEQGDRPDYRPWTKSSPPDLLAFRNETLAKYPSYTAPSAGSFLPLPAPLAALASSPQTLDRLSAAAAPIPVRPTFSYHINANHDPSLPSNQPAPPPPASWPAQQPQQPATPAPSPPPSPAPVIQLPNGGVLGGPNGGGGGPPAKPKKQQFQTDQTRPFPLPFAPANAGRGRAVPRAVEEAGELYRANLRVGTELWQAWKVREEFTGEEMGLTRAEEVERARVEKERERRKYAARELAGGEVGRKARALGRRLEALVIGDGGAKKVARAGTTSSSEAASVRGGLRGASDGDDDEEAVLSDDEDDDDDPMDPLTVLKQLGRQARREAEAQTDPKRRKELEVRRGDIKRLERVEIIYRETLAHLQSAVIVLLKLLLATVTANQNLPNPGQNGEPASSEPPPDLSLEDCDILRHREITSKAVSAILILTLKWFKTSHVMKFHYFSQLLVDSNCLLLILKMFGMQEVSTLVRVKHDRPEHNFFKFCHDHMNPSSVSPRPEDAVLSAPPPGARPGSAGSSPASTSACASAPSSAGARSTSWGDDEVELVSDYSWRNFFSTINFVHILQKLTKRKTHRILLMVQYKSSAILKRILKVSHPTLQLYVLKVIKSQVPYCGRKWRQANMKVITAIYLHCRPDLRDEWLAGVDVDADVEESLPHEQALRSLVRFFNTKHYSTHAPGLHRRSSCVPQNPNDPSPDFNPGPVASAPLPPLSPHGPPPDQQALDDVFPPPRSIASIDLSADVPLQLAYGVIDPTEDDLAGFAVDDLLEAGSGGSLDSRAHAAHEAMGAPLGGDGEMDWLNDPLGLGAAAWERMNLDEGYAGEWDDVSDGESVGGWGFMRFGLAAGEGDRAPGMTGTPADDGEEVLDERTSRHEWEHISPETITALEEERAAAARLPPHSPRPMRRRSSTGPISPALRPVLIDRDDDAAGGSAVQDGEEEGPVPTVPHEGPAIDEVELIFNR